MWFSYLPFLRPFSWGGHRIVYRICRLVSWGACRVFRLVSWVLVVFFGSFLGVLVVFLRIAEPRKAQFGYMSPSLHVAALLLASPLAAWDREFAEISHPSYESKSLRNITKYCPPDATAERLERSWSWGRSSPYVEVA